MYFKLTKFFFFWKSNVYQIVFAVCIALSGLGKITFWNFYFSHFSCKYFDFHNFGSSTTDDKFYSETTVKCCKIQIMLVILITIRLLALIVD